MKRLLFFALLAYVAWYGWNHKDTLRAGPHSEVVIENATGRELTRIRVRANGETVVREDLAAGESATLPIATGGPGNFTVLWQWADAPGEPQWNGQVASASETSRFHFRIEGTGSVMAFAEPMPAAK